MKYFKNGNIYYISLCSIMISISIIFKYISEFIPIFNGYSIDLEVIPFVYGIISIRDIKYKIIFVILCPIMWWFIVPGYSLNGVQVFVEYFLVFYIYIILLLLDFIDYKNKKLYIAIFFLLLIISTLLKSIIHMIAGAIWWTNNDYLLSFIVNSQIVFGNFSINLIVFILTINQIYILNTRHVKEQAKKIRKYYI